MGICKTENCESEATYGFRYATPEYCRLHGSEKGAKLTYKFCVCGLSDPKFALPGEKASCCGKCKSASMINVRARLCICKKSQPNFGKPDDKVPTCCAKCKNDTMINLVTKFCLCTKARPTFGIKGGKQICCVNCKTSQMICLESKLCIICGIKRPLYANTEDKAPTHCVNCKLDVMTNVTVKLCVCKKAQPSFGNKGDKTATCCIKCKSTNMIDIKSKLCRCGKKRPIFGLLTDSKPTCCASCRTDTMRNLVGSKCKGLINYQGNGDIECPFQSVSLAKYDKYCTKCFEKNFPDDKRTALICKNSKELKVKEFLSKEFKEFIHDRPIWTGQADCTCRRRIDFRWLIGNTLLCVEVDERQHKTRDQKDEDLRYDDLMMLHGGKFIFIRYNPDVYIDKNGKRKNPEIATRLASLKTSILHSIQRIQEEKNTELLEIQSLFFDEI